MASPPRQLSPTAEESEEPPEAPPPPSPFPSKGEGSPTPARKKTTRVQSMRLFRRTRSELDPQDIERSLTGEVVLTGSWNKTDGNPLAKKLAKEQERMEKEKEVISSQSKNFESENQRLVKWRVMLEKIQVQDAEAIRDLEERIAAVARERNEYASRVERLEDECVKLASLLDSNVKKLKNAL